MIGGFGALEWMRFVTYGQRAILLQRIALMPGAWYESEKPEDSFSPDNTRWIGKTRNIFCTCCQKIAFRIYGAESRESGNRCACGAKRI